MSHRIARRAPIVVIVAMALSVSLICALEAAKWQPKPQGLVLFFIGERHSEIEPCGCRVNQLGGVQFEGTLYDRVSRNNSVRVDVGGWAAGLITPETSMRARYSLRAMHTYLDIDAINVSRLELEEGAGFFDSVRMTDSASIERLISANVALRKSPDELAFPAFRIVEKKMADGRAVKVGIIGVTSNVSPTVRSVSLSQPDSAADYVIRDPSAALGEHLPNLKKLVDLTVVLFHGSWEETEALAFAHPQADITIAPVPPNDGRQFVPSANGITKILSVHNSQGKELGWADLTLGSRGNWNLADLPQWLPVSPTLPAVSAMVDLINEFKSNTAELEIPYPTGGVNRTFASATGCRSCHVGEWDHWSKTRHANALDTLIQKGSQYDPSCLPCHTLGFKTDNGFYNARQSRNMGNVQCESCHGPAAEHADRENYIRNRSILSLSEDEQVAYRARAKEVVPHAVVPEATCLQCHTPESDGHFDEDGDGKFDFERKYALIAHAASGPPGAMGAATAPPGAPGATGDPIDLSALNIQLPPVESATTKEKSNPFVRFFKKLFGGGSGE
jgi:hypothetical protein